MADSATLSHCATKHDVENVSQNSAKDGNVNRQNTAVLELSRDTSAACSNRHQVLPKTNVIAILKRNLLSELLLRRRCPNHHLRRHRLHHRHRRRYSVSIYDRRCRRRRIKPNKQPVQRVNSANQTHRSF
jgi:hypothetical protein